MKNLVLIFGSLCLVSCASNQKKAPTENAHAKAEVATSGPPALAGANQTLWKTDCRKVVNEAGKEVEPGSAARIQSSYIFGKDSVVWNVVNQSNAECKGELTSGDRYTFKCDNDPSKKIARCTQVKVESFDKAGWKEASMTDSSDYSDILIMEYRMTASASGKAKLRSRNVSDEGNWETLLLTK